MTKYIKKVSQQVPITMTLESLQELFYPIGSIVQSATLDTQDKVKAIYGGNTWEKIRGRFLLGQSTGDGASDDYILYMDDLWLDAEIY